MKVQIVKDGKNKDCDDRMAKCHFCSESSSKGKCHWVSESIRAEHCKDAIANMIAAMGGANNGRRR